MKHLAMLQCKKMIEMHKSRRLVQEKRQKTQISHTLGIHGVWGLQTH